MASKRAKLDTPTTQKGECPVCYQIPRAHIFQCVNGHSLCDICSSKLKICPTCRSDGVKIRNLLAESLLDDIKFKCSWNDHGCSKTMLRNELTTHENQCKQNPHLIKMCCMFNAGKTCEYSFTPTWLSDPKNCREFLNHITSQHTFVCLENLQLGIGYSSCLIWDFKPGFRIMPNQPSHLFYKPKFFRVVNPNNNHVHLFFRVVLLKADSYGNTNISWAIVQLTPVSTPSIVARLTINRDVNSKMVSQWGQNSSSALSWILKPIGFNEFKKMVQVSPKTEPCLSFPFSLPFSFVADYYVGEDRKLNDTMTFELKA